MSQSKSYRQILRSTSIIGGASIVNVGLALVRTKIAALLLGPIGVGLIGLFQSLMATASSIAGLGFNNVGTRQIAAASSSNDEGELASARQALLWGTMALAAIGSAVFFSLRHVLADRILEDASLSTQLGWLSLGVALTVAAGSQSAYLNGLRRIGDLARLNVFSAIFSTMAGALALLLLGQSAVVAFVLAAPVATFVAGHYFVARAPKPAAPRLSFEKLLKHWRTLAGFGTAFMLAGVSVALAQLATRTLVQRELGTEALGQFQAAWAISMTYLGFVLQAVGADYYPRLTGCMNQHDAAGTLVNEQTEVAMLLAGPVLLGILSLAPWVIELLYSDRFQQAATLLRWQAVGDVLKVASWPLSFVILATGNGRLFLFTESFGFGSFVAFTWLGLPLFGLEATGIAYVAMYVLYLPLVYFISKSTIRLTWSRPLKALVGMTSAASVAILLLTRWHSALGAVIGLCLTIALGVFSVWRLAELGDVAASARIRRILVRVPLVRRYFLSRSPNTSSMPPVPLETSPEP